MFVSAKIVDQEVDTVVFTGQVNGHLNLSVKQKIGFPLFLLVLGRKL